jgi:hypothetical protein
MADQKGFLDQLGVGSQDEGAARKAAMLAAQQYGQGRHARMARLGAQGSPVVRGAVSGVGGLITGKEGRGLDGFVKNFGGAMKAQEERLDAQAAGITPEILRSRREMRTVAAQMPQDGSLEARIALAKRMASIASQNGDAEAHGNALRMITQLETEQQEFAKLKGQVEDAETVRRQAKSLGFEARHVNDDPNVKGKAVEILTGDDAGKFRLVRPGKPDEVVTGGELIGPGLYSATGAKAPSKGASTRKFETLQGIAADQGASSGRIRTLRDGMTNLTENATIVNNMAENLLASNDPQGVVGLQGKAAVKADNAIRFVESAATVLSGRDGTNDITYGGTKENPGPRVSAQKQYELATNPSIFERFLSNAGVIDIQDALPPGIEANSPSAAQWISNVMQLAYVDARMMEPSNRGLSDKDIEAALARIGAQSGNPVNFAIRQLEMIETQLLPRLRNLGTDFTTIPTGPSNPHGYTAEDISNYVYDAETRANTENALLQTAESLQKVIAQGPRGRDESAPADNAEFADATLDDLEAEAAALRESLGQ